MVRCGLERWTRGCCMSTTERLPEFSQIDGLSSDFVLAFFEDREGNIWVGTTNGLDRFRESVVSTISASQGLSTPSLVLDVGTRWQYLDR